MNRFHKIVKCFATIFAIFLIGSIISGFASGILIFDNIFGNDKDNFSSLEQLNVTDNNYKELEIELGSSNILIKEGLSFKIESNNNHIRVREEENKLIIKDKKLINKDSNLVIYVPEGYVFDEISLDSDAGEIDIEKLEVSKLSLELGAGKVDISNLNVINKTEINGGAGEIIINNSTLNNLELDMGVGNLIINSKVLGNSEINAGIGKMEVNLLGIPNDYKIKADKGIGEFLISGVSVSDDTYYGNGINLIDINGGIGKINIRFQ